MKKGGGGAEAEGNSQVRRVDPAVDKDRAVDVGVVGWCVDGGLGGGVSIFGWGVLD